jgi:hypothetical protein
MESAREDARMDNVSRIYINYDEVEGGYEKRKPETYHPTRAQDEKAQGFGHGRSDFYSMYNFVEKLLGNPEADIINVYEALDMFLPGMFAYRSILDGNVPKEIPNLRDKSIRDLWRNDTACTDPAAAGDMLQPTFSLGTPEIDDGVYERVRTMWEEERARKAAEEAAKK